MGVSIEEPGVADHEAEGWVRIGTRGGEGALVAYELVAGSWDVTLSDDIVRDRWHKLLWNAGFNAICAITGATAGEALAMPASARLVRAAMEEVVAVAAARG